MIYETRMTLPMEGTRMLPLSTYIEEVLPRHDDGLLNIRCETPATGICLFDKGFGHQDEKLCLEHIRNEQDMERRLLRRQLWSNELEHSISGWRSKMVSYIIILTYRNALWLSDSQEFILAAARPVKDATLRLSLLTEKVWQYDYPLRMGLIRGDEEEYVIKNTPELKVGHFYPRS